MLNTYFSDYERAIAEMAKKDAAKAALWREAWRNVSYSSTTPTFAYQYGESCMNQAGRGTPVPVTDATLNSSRTYNAQAAYTIRTYYDAWPGFAREIREFLALASKSRNVVQYGGDSHVNWAGTMSLNGQRVLAEFDVMGVTSPSYERNAIMPVDLMNAAMLYGGYDTGLRHAYAGGQKAFIKVNTYAP